MGGCYSSDSESIAGSPRHKLPGERQARKGPQYSPLTNGDAPYQDDPVPERTITPVSTDYVDPTVHSQLLSAQVDQENGVVPSDSGIESIGPATEDSKRDTQDKTEVTLCSSCHNKLKRISCGPCQQCGHFRLDVSELSSLIGGETYCTCGPQQGGRQTQCVTHVFRPKVPPSPYRHSAIPITPSKSNLKKQGQGRGDSKHVRMSWKSADSLDFNYSMNTCMDRAKSEASDVFGDDVSFRAPLAQFDSVDNRLDADPEEEEEDGGDVFLASRMSIYSEILDLTDSICQCDFSDLQSDAHAQSISAKTCVPSFCDSGEQTGPSSQAEAPSSVGSTPLKLPVWPGSMDEEDEDSGHGISKSEGLSGSVSDLEMETEGKSATSCSSSFGRAAADVLESLSGDCEEVLCPVSLMVKGRRMVLMDARIYSQLLNDMTLLRTELLHLSQVMQEGNEEWPQSLTFFMDKDF